MAKNADLTALEKGTRLQAQAWDGVWYAAEVVTVSKAKNRAKAPVKVTFVGYAKDMDEWVGADKIRSKSLPKAKAKAKTAKKEVDLTVLPKGARIQAMASDGVWYAAEVVTVSKVKNRSKVPSRSTLLATPRILTSGWALTRSDPNF
jgi:ribosomal protein L10